MIALSNITKQYGAQILFVGASVQVDPGEKIGLVGPNGAGKTTLFRMMLGEELADEGNIERPRRLSIACFRQDVGDWRGKTVLEQTLSAAGEVSQLGAELAKLEERLGDVDAPDYDQVLERYGDVQQRFSDLGGYDLPSRAASILGGLGIHEEQQHADVGTLSGGWKMRVALAQILLQRPEVLLLDEPTNYLDIESILWLETFLRDYPGAVVMTCHDQEVMERVARRIIEIDGGELRSYSGSYSFYETQRALDAVQREAAYERQQAMLAKELRFIERFKAQPSKASQVQSRAKKVDKIERLEPPRRIATRHFEFRKCSRSGDEVIKVQGLRKAYGKRVIHDGLDLLVRRGERWAVMGENGAGKTTLLKMMAGVLAPDAGKVELGANVEMAYFAQHQVEQLTGSRTVLEELEAAFPTAGRGTMRNLAGAFGFSGDDVEKQISVLSGGEKTRVALAKIMFAAPNLMILDEPTNHLDLTTKRALTEALASYEGTLVFVSHDRAFLRSIATRILELTPGEAHLYPGTYDEYVTAVGREAPGMRTI
jgi:ATPase subunit of ABC transporter with duplicated ATPase domains